MSLFSIVYVLFLPVSLLIICCDEQIKLTYKICKTVVITKKKTYGNKWFVNKTMANNLIEYHQVLSLSLTLLKLRQFCFTTLDKCDMIQVGNHLSLSAFCTILHVMFCYKVYDIFYCLWNSHNPFPSNVKSTRKTLNINDCFS